MCCKSKHVNQISEVRSREPENRVMWMRITLFFLSILASFHLISSPAFAQKKGNITLLIHPHATYKVSQAISDLNKLPEVADKYNIYFYTTDDLKNGKIEQKNVAQSRFIIVDDMGRELQDYALKNVDYKKIKLYGLCSVPKEPEKIISDPKVKQYYSSPTSKNIKNLLLFLLSRDCGLDVDYAEPQIIPEMGIFHPRSSKIFADFEDYLSWYKEKGFFRKDGFWVGIPDHGVFAFPGETGEIITSLVHSLEKNSINVLPVYSFPSCLAVEKFFFDEKKRSRVDLVATFSFKFSDSNDEKVKQSFKKLGVPLLNAVKMPYRTISEWRESDQGLGLMAISYAICTPELNGLIEPSVLGGKAVLKEEQTGKKVYVYKPIKENIEFFIKRIKGWRNLQTKPNKDKKVVIMYWNHSPGKQNVGATYLNVFRSLEEILKRMHREGYTIEGKLPSEEEIKDLVLLSGRNVGFWVQGELDELIKTKRVVRLPVANYLKLYKKIDESYMEKLEAEWGKVEESKIMIKDKEVIIPYVNLGNVILVPQPTRGWCDDPMKLYHSTKLWPHHQYTAFYLWLKHEFKADAIVSLGTHGTHEWLPGKQAGLSRSCPPEVLIQDIPNLYPYIIDDIGEGVQAKRRGRGVMIDYLIPAMKKAGVYDKYIELAGIINEYNDALTRSSELAEQKFKRIETVVKKLGLDKDLLLKEVNEKAVEEIQHYLLDLGEANVPYGMHTFGVSPEGEALEEFGRLIKDRNETLDLNEIKKKLSMCYLEIDNLIAGLDGKYIPSGEGNDPLRNPEAIPTGKNFYGFDAAKVPSKDAYALGKKQAEEMVDKFLKEKGKYPDKIGLVLWSIELQRNEGTQVGTALHLIGMKPVWDKNNKVIGVEPILGKLLGRPRIDVHLQSSGLFRDNFPNLILLLDEAVRQASQLKDVENFIAKHSRKIKGYLVEKGYSEEDAENLSKIRIFSARPGSYGTKVEDLIPASGLWESDEDVADVFINFVSFGYGKGVWGKSLKSVYKKNLEDVKVAMHSRSSNLFGVLDVDGVYGSLGAFSLAVKKVGGEYPDVVLSIQGDPDAAHIEDIERTIGEELRARYLNPKWIEGMKKEKYAGAWQMNKFVEYMWGHQVTIPFAIDETKWEQVYEVYVEDKYGMELKKFFNKENPWAYQSITARMLEAVRKEYWQPDEKITRKLSVEYALNVVERGVACCDHTCNNPALNQMVVNIISLPGVMSPEMVKKFKLAIEQSVGKALIQQISDRKNLQNRLKEGFKERSSENSDELSKTSSRQKAYPTPGDKIDFIEGYKMEEVKSQDETTDLSSYGVQWFASIFIILIIGLFVFGARRRK